MRAFQTALKPSRFLRITQMLLHLVAAIAALIAHSGWEMYLIWAVLLVSAAFAWKVSGLCLQDSVLKIAVNTQGRAEITTLSSGVIPAALSGSSVLTSYALFLVWDCGAGKQIRHCVLPDMADKDSYRRLKVWVRWGATQEQADLEELD